MRPKHKLAKTTVKWRMVGGGSLGLIAVVMMALLFPHVTTNTQAADLTTTLASKTSAHLHSMISLSVSNNIDIDLQPQAGGSLAVGSGDIIVATNNTTGYSVLLSTADHSNQLKPTNPSDKFSNQNGDYAIMPLQKAITSGQYISDAANLNTWGYAVTSGEPSNTTVYTGLTDPTSNPIISTKSTTRNDYYKLNIAVAADTNLPAGNYQNSLVISAVTNPAELHGFDQIDYMQEMTAAICADAEIGATKQLVDRRDNNVYWVTRLKDGNCWMTQNLALELSTDQALTAADTDLNSKEEWTPTSSTNAVKLANGVNGGNGIERQYSWALPKSVIAKPNSVIYCNSFYSDDNPAEICSEGIVDVSNDDWLPIFTAQNDSLGNFTAVDQTNRTYDPHYLTGNYYAWSVATAGSVDTNLTYNDQTPDSICPKGWRLPAASKHYKDPDTNLLNKPLDQEKSFYRLLLAYGYPEWNEYNIMSGTVTPYANTSQDPAQNPFVNEIALAKAGNVPYRWRDDGKYPAFSDLGSTAMLWGNSGQTVDNRIAFYLSATSRQLSPAYANGYSYGLNVRCVAR